MGIPLTATGALGWELGVALGPFAPQSGPPQLRYPSPLDCHIMSVGPAPSASLPLPDLTRLLLYILSYGTCIQLVFSWFSMIVLP